MLKTESTTARSIDETAVLVDGNVLLEKMYSPTDDKFLLVFQRMEDIRLILELQEQGTTEADDQLCDIWVQKTTMIVAKPGDTFQVVPEDEQMR